MLGLPDRHTVRPRSLRHQRDVRDCFSGAYLLLAQVQEVPIAGSDLSAAPGQIRVKYRVSGARSPKGVSSGTCVCGIAPPEGPGTEVSRSAAGKGVPTGQWHSPARRGPESASGPGSPSEPGRSEPKSKHGRYLV